MLQAEAVVADGAQAEEPLGRPEDEDEVHPWDLGQSVQLQVLVQAEESSNDHEAVDVEKGLVKGVTEWRPGLDADECEGDSSDHAPSVRALGVEGSYDGGPSTTSLGVIQPSGSVDNGFGNGDSSSPAVEKVEVVVRDLEKRDEGVVAEGEEDGGNEVEGGEGSRASAKGGERLLVVEDVVGEGKTPCNVEAYVDEEHDGVPSSREGSVVNSAADLELGVVLLLPERGDEDMTVEPGPPACSVGLPVLLLGVSHCGDVSAVLPEHVGDAEHEEHARDAYEHVEEGVDPHEVADLVHASETVRVLELLKLGGIPVGEEVALDSGCLPRAQ